jgi:hypothetical protein
VLIVKDLMSGFGRFEGERATRPSSMPHVVSTARQLAQRFGRDVLLGLGARSKSLAVGWDVGCRGGAATRDGTSSEAGCTERRGEEEEGVRRKKKKVFVCRGGLRKRTLHGLGSRGGRERAIFGRSVCTLHFSTNDEPEERAIPTNGLAPCRHARPTWGKESLPALCKSRIAGHGLSIGRGLTWGEMVNSKNHPITDLRTAQAGVSSGHFTQRKAA